MASTSPDRFGEVRRYKSDLTLMSIGPYRPTGSHTYIVLYGAAHQAGYISKWGQAAAHFEKIEPKVKDA